MPLTAQRVIEIVDLVAEQLAHSYDFTVPRPATEELPISGGDVGGSVGFESFLLKKIKEGVAVGLTEEEAERMVRLYGSNVDRVLARYVALVDEASEEGADDGGNEGIPPLLCAQLQYGIEEEMVCRPADFFVRRTGAMFFNIDWVIDNKEAVVQYMARIFEWSDDRSAEMMAELDELIEDARGEREQVEEESV
ncbi:glycerol-3-phosphate dehydrogenase C-terminal domain-containing protein [Bacillaceae bacterium W0354]